MGQLCRLEDVLSRRLQAARAAHTGRAYRLGAATTPKLLGNPSRFPLSARAGQLAEKAAWPHGCMEAAQLHEWPVVQRGLLLCSAGN